jgi:hypothetical protein
VTNILNTGKILPIADPSIKELMTNQGKGMLITGGLIMKRKKITSMSGKKDSGAHLA